MVGTNANIATLGIEYDSGAMCWDGCEHILHGLYARGSKSLKAGGLHLDGGDVRGDRLDDAHTEGPNRIDWIRPIN